MTLLSNVKSTISKVITAITPTKAKIENVIQVEKAAITGKGVTANTPSAAVNKVLSAAASNPLTTAAIITPVNTVTAVATGFKALSTTAKVITVGASVVTVPAIISNPSLVSKAAATPSNLANFGSNLGEFTKEPSLQSAANIVKENPVLSTIAVGAAGLIAGKGVTGIANTIAVAENTAATNKAVQSISKNVSTLPTENMDLPKALQTTTTGISPVPITADTQVIGKQATSVSKSYKKKSNKISKANYSQSIRLNIFNQSKLQSVKYLNLESILN